MTVPASAVSVAEFGNLLPFLKHMMKELSELPDRFGQIPDVALIRSDP
ncbi:MAG: hypothetical protein WAT77_04500 [Paracoccaceae bacterium]